MRLLLIAGHGAGDPGATSKVNNKSYFEHVENRELVSRLFNELKGSCGVTVYPEDRNAYQDYKKGTLASVAKFSHYDYVLEVHFNAFQASAPDGKTKGTSIYVTTGETGVTVEEAIVRNIAALGFHNRGVKRKNFSVIQKAKQSGVSSALLEVCFIDDPDDMAVYEANREKVVKAVADGIREGFGLQTTAERVTAASKVIQQGAGLSDATMKYMRDYRFGDDLLLKLAAWGTRER